MTRKNPRRHEAGDERWRELHREAASGDLTAARALVRELERRQPGKSEEEILRAELEEFANLGYRLFASKKVVGGSDVRDKLVDEARRFIKMNYAANVDSIVSSIRDAVKADEIQSYEQLLDRISEEVNGANRVNITMLAKEAIPFGEADLGDVLEERGTGWQTTTGPQHNNYDPPWETWAFLIVEADVVRELQSQEDFNFNHPELSDLKDAKDEDES